MKAELVTQYGDDLSPVNAARVSFANESQWEEGEVDERGRVSLGLRIRDAKLIDYLAKHKHTSCFEHQGATLRIKVPIFIARQIQRHRTFSYNEVSRRYVDIPPEFFWPDKWRKRADNVKQGSSDEEVTKIMCKKYDTELRHDTQESAEIVLADCVNLYESMLDSGVAPELARIVLPQNMYTEFYMTGNLRNWAHFLKLRLDGHAQLEVQQLAQQVHDILKPLFPVSVEALMKYD